MKAWLPKLKEKLEALAKTKGWKLGDVLAKLKNRFLQKGSYKIFKKIDLQNQDKVPFDPQKLERIKESLKKQGIIVQQDDDAKHVLDLNNAEAAYLPNSPDFPDDVPILMLRENPSRAAVIEELLHLGQHRKLGFAPDFFTELVKYEIEAQQKLLVLGKRLGWNNFELKEIEDALEYWRNKR